MTALGPSLWTCEACGARTMGAACSMCGAARPLPPQPYPPQGYPPQGYPPQGYPPQGYPQQGYPPQGYGPPGQWGPGMPPPPGKTNTLAIIALVASLLWVGGIGSLIAIVLAIVAMKQIRVRQESGQGLAVAGLVIGIAGLALTVAGVLVALAVGTAVDDVQSRASVNACRTDTKTLKTAIVEWNTEFLTGDNPAYNTPWPTNDGTGAGGLNNPNTLIIREPSDLHDLRGDGSKPPIIVKEPGECKDEVITQLS